MNKKFYYGLFAAGMLFATSCSNDDLTQVMSGEYADVSISLGVEEVAGSRAISDGTGADELYYAVFNSTGQRITTIAQVHKTGVTFPTTETITLAKGQTYKVAFWAQDDDCTAYTVSDDMNVTVNYAGINNDETRDAFFKTVEFTVNGSTSLDVELKRPFAQINVGVETTDWNDAVASGVEIKESNVTIENAATSINLVTGKVDGSAKVDYTTSAIPAEPLKANNSTYNWLSMSYILVNDGSETGDTETTLKSLNYTFTPESGNTITFKEGLNNVPVKRNWRTNILGKILTGDIQFNISIDPIYDGDIIYPSKQEQELEMAATFGGTVTLTEDVTLTAPLNVTADMVLNLNGYTITGEFSDKALINNTGTLKLMGTGTINNTAENGAAVITNSGKLVLDGVKIEGAPIGTTGYPSYAVSTSGELTVEEGTIISSDRGAIYMSNGANVTINGGNIKVTNALGTRVLTAHVIYAYGKNSKLTINDGNFEMAYTAAGNTGASVICPAGATIDVYGGNFSYAGTVGQSGIFQNYMGYGVPVNVYGGTYTDNTVEKNVASGYKAIKSGDKWYVVAYDIDAIVSSAEELKTAVNEGSTTIWMKAASYDTKDFQFSGKTLYLKGMEDGVKIYNSQSNNVASTSFDMCTVTFENLTIETLGGYYKGFARMNGTYKNCTIVNNYFTCYGKHLFENCTFNAPTLTGSFQNEHCMWTYGAEEVDFVNCEFNYSDRGVNVYVDNGGNAPGITSDVTFTNCVFNTENTASEGAVEVNSTPFTAGVKVVLENCTAPAYGKMVYVSPWDSTEGKTATIIANGKLVAGLTSALENAPAGSTIVLSEDANLGTVTVSELKNVTIKGAEGSVMIFKTTADTKIENVTLQNVSFEYTGATADCGVVIDANAQIDNLVLEGCTFIGTGAKAGRGLSGFNNNASIVIKDCKFKDLGYPIYAWGGYEALTIEGCTFDNIKSWAIMPQSGFNGDLTVTGCTFQNCLGGGLIKAGTLTAGHTFTFTNNVITNCTVAGDHNWFQFNVSAGTSVISGNKKDGADWTPGTTDGLK